jgi:DNA-binding transcriptional LysR family regulator
MELRQLRIFEAVVRHRTVTDAAIGLGMAPSSVSEQIRALEKSLGVALFHRTARGMRLATMLPRASPAGTVLQPITASPGAKEAIEQFTRLAAAVTAGAGPSPRRQGTRRSPGRCRGSRQ